MGMANRNDSFIDEVTDDLRRERVFRALRRYGWIALAAMLLAVGYAGWREWDAGRRETAAQRFGDAILAAEGTQGDAAARAAALSAVQAPQQAQAALRNLLAGNAMAEAGDAAGAAQRYDAAAAAAAGDPVMHDLALLRSVMVQGRGMDAAARDGALARLSTPGAPFEMIALELKALALVDAGRDEDAVTLIRQIQQKDGLSQAQRRRLSELLITLGVEPEPEPSAQLAPDPTRSPEVVSPAPRR